MLLFLQAQLGEPSSANPARRTQLGEPSEHRERLGRRAALDQPRGRNVGPQPALAGGQRLHGPAEPRRAGRHLRLCAHARPPGRRATLENTS